MKYDDLNTERRAIYGFRYGSTDYKGWLNSIFESYTLYPYLNLFRKETHELFFKKNLLQKLVPAFSKKLRITNLLNSLIGIDLLKETGKGIGLIEELAKIVLDEIESRRNLEDRIRTVEKSLVNNAHFFSGLTYPINSRENFPVFTAKSSSADGALVALEGILNNVKAAAALNPALGHSFEGSGIEWIISDFPFFSMTSDNPSYDGNVVAVKFSKGIESLISDSVPFKRDFGWYPYVTIFGIYHSSMSPLYSNIKVIDWLWMKFRPCRSFDVLAPILEVVLKDQDHKDNAYKPWLDLGTPEDLMLFLSAIQIVHGAHNIPYADIRDDVSSLAENALEAAGASLPSELKMYFKNVAKS